MALNSKKALAALLVSAALVFDQAALAAEGDQSQAQAPAGGEAAGAAAPEQAAGTTSLKDYGLPILATLAVVVIAVGGGGGSGSTTTQ